MQHPELCYRHLSPSLFTKYKALSSLLIFKLVRQITLSVWGEIKCKARRSVNEWRSTAKHTEMNPVRLTRPGIPQVTSTLALFTETQARAKLCPVLRACPKARGRAPAPNSTISEAARCNRAGVGQEAVQNTTDNLLPDFTWRQSSQSLSPRWAAPGRAVPAPSGSSCPSQQPVALQSGSSR